MIIADFSRATWRKSSRSSEATNCVEITLTERVIGVRDSKHPTGPILTFPAASLAHLVGARVSNSAS